MKLIKNVFGKLPDGSDVYLYTIVNESMEISLTNYGCIITSLKVLDRNDDLGEVVLGFDKLESYLKPHPYFGAIVGPVANRISGAKYVFNNEEISLDANEGKNQLHGGSMGFDKMLWREVSIVEDENFKNVTIGRANNMSNCGNAYKLLGDETKKIAHYKKAINCHLDALGMNKKLKAIEGQAANHANLGLLYTLTGETKHAITGESQDARAEYQLAMALFGESENATIVQNIINKPPAAESSSNQKKDK